MLVTDLCVGVAVENGRCQCGGGEERRTEISISRADSKEGAPENVADHL